MYFSVDIESNGPIPGEYSMTALGCCVVGQPDRSFYVELKPISDKVVPHAEQVGGLTLDYLRINGADPAEAMARFDSWVRETAGEDRQPVFVAFNATYDWLFVHWYLTRFVGHSPFSHSGLDVKAYYMGMADVSWAETGRARLPDEFKAGKHTHHALEDAREQAEMFARMLAHNATSKEAK
jgi:DNA polymerase III epsilon subunit-like protein